MSDRLVIRDWESVLVRNEKKLSGRVRPAGPLAYRFENSRDAKCEKSDTRRRMSPKSGPKRLRELLQQPGIICSLGAHDVFTDAVRRLAAVRVCIPAIADADTGYGDLHIVQRTVEAFEAAGASGILLEDQVMPKRCGHFADKRVIPGEEMVLKIKAAVKAKSDRDWYKACRRDHEYGC